jgi:uncharacterized protein
MDLSARERRLEEKVEEMFKADSTGHDMQHLFRVRSVALHIQEAEGGDAEVIATAALLHDVHRLMEKTRGSFCPPAESLPIIRPMLEDVSFPAEKIERVLHCIELHEEYAFSKKGNAATDIETLILQDADNLDAIGAIGVSRTFAFSGSYGIPSWRPDLPFDREHFDEAVRDPSTLHHIHAKLLKLKDNMNTKTGKAMAEARHEFMERFVEEFIAEWRGER